MRGGPQRTRTACQAPSHVEPVSETSQTARLVGLEPVSSWTLESRRETEFYEQRQTAQTGVSPSRTGPETIHGGTIAAVSLSGAKTTEHREMLLKMAETWEGLAAAREKKLAGEGKSQED